MNEVHYIVPAGPKPLFFFIPILVLLIGVLGLLVATAHASQRAHFDLTDSGLRLRGDLYARSIAYDRLIVDQARLVDLRGEPALQPVSRRVGTGVPGYAAGWFRLRNGQKALVYLTDRTRVLHLPTRDGYTLLLSPTRPDEMLAALQRRSPG